jgi:hypothetical protein
LRDSIIKVPLGFALLLRLEPLIPKSPKEHCMSAPSRRPEIRRRRTRTEKVQKLRKRLAAASGADKDRLLAKLHRYEQVSPGNPLVKTA